ncbi:MAG TPA: HD domain-containing protein [Pyrinomonadaceae bacterium]|nr:HD domain-containing protein [Pyrinomonadaceae bacterium]
MPLISKKFSLIYFVLITLFLVGVVPLILTGWFLSDRSGKELRAVEGRYQTQLVQDKARQIEMFGQRYGELVTGIAKAFELSPDFSLLSSEVTQQKLGQTLKENPNLIALYVKPIQGEPLSLYRTEMLDESELQGIASGVLAKMNGNEVVWGKPIVLKKGFENVVSIAVPVYGKENITAAVVALISLSEFGRILSEVKPSTEKELWDAGLPIIFVVDEKGKAIFHPDLNVITSQKNLSTLKIVEEWKDYGQQIQSAQVPFTAEYDNKKFEMIGAYSTAKFNKEMSFGVIAMQDESRALASVGEMRRQTWVISLALAIVALIVGSLFARQLTATVSNLVSAAERIGAGDLTNRIQANQIKELNTLGITFNSMSENLAENIAKLNKAAQENRDLFVGTVKALAAAIDGKDRYTRGHSERVARFSVAIGKRLGLDDAEMEKLRISALLHDVGKIAIDDNILKKPAALTDDEFEIMKTHPQKGYKIMSQIPAMEDFLPGMYMHHEMVNGKGYPQGLRGNEIPLQAKIVSVADTFDAMTTDRPYSKGMNLEDSLNRIKSFVGTRYDGKVVEALVEACYEGQIRPVGAVHPKTLEREELSSQQIIKIV